MLVRKTTAHRFSVGGCFGNKESKGYLWEEDYYQVLMVVHRAWMA
jgi:hypothetical protein